MYRIEVQSLTLSVPREIIEKAERKGVDLESLILEVLIEKLDLNPDDASKIHISRAKKFLDEGKELISKDSVQASEKLYKAAEECVKGLTYYFNIEDVINEGRRRGRWTVSLLEKAVEEISEKLGTWFRRSVGQSKLPPCLGLPRGKTRCHCGGEKSTLRGENGK